MCLGGDAELDAPAGGEGEVVGGLVEGVAGVPADPFDADVAADQVAADLGQDAGDLSGLRRG